MSQDLDKHKFEIEYRAGVELTTTSKSLLYDQFVMVPDSGTYKVYFAGSALGIFNLQDLTSLIKANGRLK